MKTPNFSTQVLILMVMLLFFNDLGNTAENQKAESGAIDVAQNTRFFEALDIRLVDMMNLARQDPSNFAETYLSGRVGKGGQYAELFRRMKTMQPVAPLRHSKALSLAARDHVKDMYSARIENEGEGAATRWTRIEKYAKWEGHVAVNISYGYSDPDNIVVHLLLNAGDPQKSSILDPQNRFAGSRIGKHKKYRYMCVVYFAAHIEE